jgi:hydroxyacylglutathione hydrolase
VYLLVGDGEPEAADVAAAAARDLALIGLEKVVGYFDDEALAAAGALEKVPQMNTAELAERLDDERPPAVMVLDVRERGEWEAGHIAGAVNVPLGHLTDRVAELERERPLVLHCQSGGRSSVAASVLRAHGFTNVINLSDGFAGWQRRGLPIERPAPADEPAPDTRV